MIPDDEIATYEMLLLIVDQEEYHTFLEERINIHEISDEFEVEHFKGKDKLYDAQAPLWILAEYEDYVEVEPTGIGKDRIKVLKHYEIPPYERYFN